MDTNGHSWTKLDSANFSFRNFAAKKKCGQKRTFPDICGQMRTVPNFFFVTLHREKEGENGRQPRPNGLVVSAGKCAGPIPAKNCANAQKITSGPKYIRIRTSNYFPHAVRFSADY
jgi:hypothetical protein